MSDHQHSLVSDENAPVVTIDRDALKDKLDKKAPIKLVMTLNRWAFDAKHIPGSLHFDSPDELYSAVDKDDEVIVYCTNVDCKSSVGVYWDLLESGYTNVRRYAGGLMEWEESGLPLEGELVRNEN